MKESGSTMNEEDVRLANAKKDRQKMEQAAVILENRVLYLEKINEKMNKKIESVKTRATEIMRLKKQAKEEEEAKRQLQESQEANLRERQQLIHEMRTQREERLNTSKLNSMSQSAMVAKTTKESLAVDSQGAQGAVQTAEGGGDATEVGERAGDPGNAQERDKSEAGVGGGVNRTKASGAHATGRWRILSER